ncbi:MAG: N-acetylglucosamine-6-phosphate deacetylase [Clostridia bacterium]|nr:N-acetylglucosamine-6-phosphate deacetylase [Clostridia bacterium]
MTVLKNVLHKGTVTDIVLSGGKIESIGKTELPGIELSGLKVYPGLIDTHIHGALGHDVSDPHDSLDVISDYELRSGVTTWYPTTVAVDAEQLVKVTNRDVSLVSGANIPGFHMEGPFINKAKKGAINEEHIIPASRELFDRCNASGLVKKMTVAPETEGALEFIEDCPALISVGHTTCDYDTAAESFRRGARCLTHTYNVMPGIHHREPGPIGAGADSKDIYAELISDGVHIHPSAVRMLVRIYGTDRIVLVSDSVRATGLSDGEYDLGGVPTVVKDGVARTLGGNLAGSTTNLFDCVRCAISFGICEEDAVKMASDNPARMMGLNKGRVEVGYDADLIIVDGDFNLKHVIKGGELCVL